MMTRWLLAVMGIAIIFLLLPWTQNIQSKGKVTTLRPEQRPQIIPSPIDARIERWYVREGQAVKKGDTIVFISEIKADYLDPELVPRTEQQVAAKEGAVVSYQDKVNALQDQIANMEAQLRLKRQQLQQKIDQVQFKIGADRADLAQAVIQDSIAKVQYQRAQSLFERGIDSRAKVEEKQAKLQETRNKVIASENKLNSSQAELRITQTELNAIQAEYSEKIAKARSDIASTLSQKFDTEADVNKLRIQSSNYARRAGFYYITAPQDCYITKTVTPGIGETIKEGDGIVSIMPKDYELAVELYVEPMDFPLVNVDTSAGKKPEVRFIFDGWPAFVFSGWPGQSFGTYVGEIAAIDNEISSNGKYRILVAYKPGTKPWPKELRVGSGSQGIVLLNNVPLWYEIWRQLNGFPPDYYASDEQEEALKQKTPVQLIK
jgi:multidrug resistance efflux pump